MKVLILNASPRKQWNTAKVLQEAQRGALAAGHEVTYIDVYDIGGMGCRSCLVCKNQRMANPCQCYWQDALTPIINRVYTVDRLILGAPIYFGHTPSQFHAITERVCFPALSYDTYGSTFQGSIDVDVFLTMNANEAYYKASYESVFQNECKTYSLLNGNVYIHPVYDTLQVSDYSQYRMAAWDPVHKQAVHDSEFPTALAHAFQVGLGNREGIAPLPSFLSSKASEV